MKTNDIEIEAAAKDSWVALIDDPTKDYEFTLREHPEMIEAHQRVVRATIEADFEPMKAERLVSDNKRTWADLFDRTKKFRIELTEFLKKWMAKHR